MPPSPNNKKMLIFWTYQLTGYADLVQKYIFFFLDYCFKDNLIYIYFTLRFSYYLTIFPLQKNHTAPSAPKPKIDIHSKTQTLPAEGGEFVSRALRSIFSSVMTVC